MLYEHHAVVEAAGRWLGHMALRGGVCKVLELVGPGGSVGVCGWAAMVGVVVMLC